MFYKIDIPILHPRMKSRVFLYSFKESCSSGYNNLLQTKICQFQFVCPILLYFDYFISFLLKERSGSQAYFGCYFSNSQLPSNAVQLHKEVVWPRLCIANPCVRTWNADSRLYSWMKSQPCCSLRQKHL